MILSSLSRNTKSLPLKLLSVLAPVAPTRTCCSLLPRLVACSSLMTSSWARPRWTRAAKMMSLSARQTRPACSNLVHASLMIDVDLQQLFKYRQDMSWMCTYKQESFHLLPGKVVLPSNGEQNMYEVVIVLEIIRRRHHRLIPASHGPRSACWVGHPTSASVSRAWRRPAPRSGGGPKKLR